MLPPADQRGRVLTLLDRVIFFGLIAVIVLTAIPYGTAESWSKALFESAVFFLTLLGSSTIDGWIVACWQPAFDSSDGWLVVLAAVQSVAWWQVDNAGRESGSR